MHFYQSLGYLVFGSRLKRISEIFLNDVNRIYQTLEIGFEASWFPVFYILSNRQEVSIRDIADELNVSHSAISQLASALQQKGLLEIRPSTTDARKKVIGLSENGEKLLQQITPIWKALARSMETMAAENKHSRHLLKAIDELEESLAKESLFDRVYATIKPANASKK